MRTLDYITDLVVISGEAENPMTRRIQKTHPDITVHVVLDDEIRLKLDDLKSRGVESKKILLISDFKGRLIQKCPGTKDMICCNYMLINSGFNCIYDCVYCFLQSYLNSYGILLFANTDEILAQTDEFISHIDPAKTYRIGTGEFTDSLMLDEYTGLSEKFISKFAHAENVYLELKTKSSNIDHLEGIRDKGNTVVAWSVNTEKNIALYEEGTASLDERIEAAEKAAEYGYNIAFHFDPVILYEGWESEYQSVIDRIFRNIDPAKILWISVGGVRFTAEFREIMRYSWPDEDISLGEFVSCRDGKMRYFSTIRRKLYSFFRDAILAQPDPPFLYMCMESAQMWEDVFGKVYSSSDDLEDEMTAFLRRRKAIQANKTFPSA